MTLSWTPPDALPTVIDGAEVIRVVVQGTPTAAANGTNTYPNSANYNATTAKRLRVTIREAETSGGKLNTNDIKFHIAATDLTVDPDPAADYVLTGASLDVRWNIILAEKILLGTRYRLYCRKS